MFKVDTEATLRWTEDDGSEHYVSVSSTTDSVSLDASYYDMSQIQYLIDALTKAKEIINAQRTDD